MMRSILVFVLLLWVHVQSFGQKWNPYAKGHMYFFWGWNRAAYTKSDLSIKGADYDLLLKKIVAHDRPTTPVNYHNYLQPDRLTIPQNNWRIGYFIKDNLALSFGTDHMKYVMDQDQWVEVEGSISREGAFKGNYTGPTQLTPAFLTFEHTDGLNYVNVELEKFRRLIQSANDKFLLSWFLAAGAGMLLPKTNVKFLDYERNDRFHVSGFGLDLKAGLETIFWHHLAIRLETKTGYINMPNIILHKKGIEGKGRQQFMFAELDGAIAWNFRVARPNKRTTTDRNIH